MATPLSTSAAVAASLHGGTSVASPPPSPPPVPAPAATVQGQDEDLLPSVFVEFVDVLQLAMDASPTTEGAMKLFMAAYGSQSAVLRIAFVAAPVACSIADPDDLPSCWAEW